MVQYTLAESPEIVLTVSGKDTSKAREKAMDQLMELMESGQLPTDLPNGFGPQQFIEVRQLDHAPSVSEDAVTEAVQILSNFATLKLKLQEQRAAALQVREQIDILFTDVSVDEEQIAHIKEGFKTLKTFAQANLRFQEARTQAEQARTLLDQALQSPPLEHKAEKNGNK
jgi:soluble cytochrome b562